MNRVSAIQQKQYHGIILTILGFCDMRNRSILNILCKAWLIIAFVICLALPSSLEGFDRPWKKIVGTHYTGSTWAPAFWSNLDICAVHDDFLEIRKNGFNTVIIIVPWVGFQTSVEPIGYFDDYFELLNSIFRIAQEVGLNVILRVGYAHEIGTRSIPGHYERVINLFANKNMLRGWSDYLKRLYKAASKYDNFLFGFITWEDFFLIDFTHLPVEKRTFLSARIGYQEYLTRYSLTSLSEIYMKMFSSYTEIPIPSYNSSAVPLFYEFWDQLLIRIYKESKKHFPKLSLEVRVDCDPSHGSTKYNCHESTFDLGGEGDITIIYYTPAWGALNKGDQATADEAILRFQHLLDWVSSHTDNLVFIDQFNFVDNTIGFERNTKIVSGEVPSFIDKSVSPISDKTMGYALWAMKDVRSNVIKNGSFERGNLGWVIDNGKLSVDKDEKQSIVLLGNMGILTQDIRCGSHSQPLLNKNEVSFSLRFKAKRIGKVPSELSIRITDKEGQILYENKTSISFDNFETICVDEVPLFANGILNLTNAGADVALDDFVLFFCVQENGIYDVFGVPRYFRNNVVALNQSLSTHTRKALEYYDKTAIQMASIDGVYNDGWTGEIVSGEIMVPSNGKSKSFVVESYVPDTWTAYINKITVKISDMVVGSSPITPGYNKIRFTMDREDIGGKIVPFKILSEKTYSPSNFEPMSQDERELSFVLVGVGFAE